MQEPVKYSKLRKYSYCEWIGMRMSVFTMGDLLQPSEVLTIIALFLAIIFAVVFTITECVRVAKGVVASLAS